MQRKINSSFLKIFSSWNSNSQPMQNIYEFEFKFEISAQTFFEFKFEFAAVVLIVEQFCLLARVIYKHKF